MKIAVLNGSPKGEISVTRHYVDYIQKNFPQHQLKILNVCQTINSLEKDPQKFKLVIEEVAGSDGVLWVFPVTYFLIHSNYKRFVELIRERNADAAFKGKYTAVVSTSIHIFDNIANDYMHSICDDLNMKYTGFFPASMDDLTVKAQQKRICFFASDFFETINKKLLIPKITRPLDYAGIEYIPGEVRDKVDCKDKKILFITDSVTGDGNLEKIIKRLADIFNGQKEIINVNDISISGGCLGCVNCAFDNKCVYKDKDDIEEIYNTKIKDADIIIMGVRIVDRYFSSRWKMFYDRRFLNTHQPQMMRKQVGFVVSGPLGLLPALRETIRFQTEIDHANLAWILTDENENSCEIDIRMEEYARSIVYDAERGYARPFTFLGVGAGLICRDLIWGKWRFIFRGDHKFYKKHGMHDYPHKKIGMRIVNLLLTIFCKISVFRKGLQKNIGKYEAHRLALWVDKQSTEY
jgi:multimeric flavodoxin WrbA/NAD(P)H-dependent FMN reductase